MRKIKFRAWDGEKVIDFGDLMCKQGHYDVFENTISKGTAAHNKEKRTYELMQYTGLKDKNGVEIYEWDIVRWQSERLEVIEFPFIDEDIQATEVIGNLYENGDLLK